jgi:hypothetical protein
LFRKLCVFAVFGASFSMSNLDWKTAVEQEEAYLRLVHPTPDDVPGCMKLFDDFLSCNGANKSSHSWQRAHPPLDTVIRAQVISLYRYGERSSCRTKMDEFKFCMSLKSMHPEDRREAWIRRRAEWWASRRLTKSSESVWDMRRYVQRACCLFVRCAEPSELIREPLPNFPRPINDEQPEF